MIKYQSGYIYARCDDCGTKYKGGCLTPENLDKLVVDQGWIVLGPTAERKHLCPDCRLQNEGVGSKGVDYGDR